MLAQRSAPTFLCDSMLGGLARWLRAVGYAARFEPCIDDGELVAQARETGALLLSSDARLFERRAVRDGSIRALFIPRHQAPFDQVVFVLRQLALPVCSARCMKCGGALATIAKAEVAETVPPRAYAAHEEYFRCTACGGIYWHGTHWQRIAEQRARVSELVGAGGASGSGMHAVFFGMKRAFLSANEWMKKVFVPHGLTPARFDMLYALGKEEFVYQGYLVSMLGVSEATVSRMLKSLRQLGLVESFPDEMDRRRNFVALTEHGEAVLERAIEVIMGSGLGELAVASTIDEPYLAIKEPDTVAAYVRRFLSRLGCVRAGFRDRAVFTYGNFAFD